MYNEYFQLDKTPFSILPTPDFYCDLNGHVEAISLITHALNQGEPIIKIIGEVGVGKTVLCKRLINLLDKSYCICKIMNPDLSSQSFKEAIALQLGLEVDLRKNDTENTILSKIQNLISSIEENKKSILVIVDEAQAMSDETLESLRLMTNLDSTGKGVFQILLLGQPELDVRLSRSHLRQLGQRITTSYYMPKLDTNQLSHYLSRRLLIAGHKHGVLFSEKAKSLILKKSGGVARIINVISHKALVAAYLMNDKIVNKHHVKAAIKDSVEIISTKKEKAFSFNFKKILIFTEIIIILFIILLLLNVLFF